MFTPLPFEKLNEADVREEIIAPLLRRLGYRSGSENNIIREQLLRYPRLSLGRKDPKKDPELRGKADYILEVQGCIRWVIEAKAPEVAIDLDCIEQAWTYASHPEIRSVYFVLCNGRTLTVYRTAHGPDAGPVLSLVYENLEHDFQLLANLLAPEALLRDFPTVTVDVGLPIAPGLRSLARITNGIIRYERNSLGLTVLSELQTGITEGAVERDDAGKLVAFLRTTGPSRSLQELNERLGLSTFEMVSEDSQLSTDPGRPTLFSYRNRIILPAGEKWLDPVTWRHVELLRNITCDVTATAQGTFHERIFAGAFATLMQYLEFGRRVTMSGSFEAHLA